MKAWIAILVGLILAGCQPQTPPGSRASKEIALEIPLNARAGDFYTRVRNDAGEYKVSGRVTKLADDTIVLRQRTKNGEDELELKFWDNWFVELAFGSKVGADLTPYTDNGFLSFQINPEKVADASLDVIVGCTLQCRHKFRLRDWAVAHEGQGWQKVDIPVSCLAPAETADAVTAPVTFRTGGKGKISLKNLRFTDQSTDPLTCPQDVATTPAVLDEYWSRNWWLPRHKTKVAEARKKAAQVVLIGDSITQGWEDSGKSAWDEHFPDIDVLNLGFSGDRTENTLWRLREGELTNQNAPLTLIMIGTNNTGHRLDRPEAIRDGVAAIIDEVQKQMPDTHIVLQAIFPRGTSDDDPMRQNNQMANALLSEMAYKKKVEFVNLNRIFLEEDGVLTEAIMPDFLHLNEAGYAIWAKELVPIIDKYVGLPAN